MANKKPEKVFRVGAVSASVFVRDIKTDGGERAVCGASVQTRYVDGDEVKYTSSFDLAELPQAVRVLQLAQHHVEAREAELSID